MRLKFNDAKGIDTQTGAIVQMEATRMYITSDMGARETDAEGFCRYSQTLMIVATIPHCQPTRQRS